MSSTSITETDLQNVQATHNATSTSAEKPQTAVTPTDKKLDQILEFLEQTSARADLAEREFNLKYDVTQQGLKHQGWDFTFLLIAKISIAFFALTFVAILAYQFHSILIGATKMPLLEGKDNAILAIVVGSFLTMFGTLAVLVKALTQKEKSETPLALEEVAKAILGAFKTVK